MTLTTNDSYAKGALVLGLSLKQHRTTRRLVVLITPQVSDSMRWGPCCRAVGWALTSPPLFLASVDLKARPFPEIECWWRTMRAAEWRIPGSETSSWLLGDVPPKLHLGGGVLALVLTDHNQELGSLIGRSSLGDPSEWFSPAIPSVSSSFTCIPFPQREQGLLFLFPAKQTSLAFERK